MRLVAYEWCSSGGLSDPDAAQSGEGHAHERLLREGRAMLEAIAADAARDGSLDVTVLIDERLPVSSGDSSVALPAGVRRVPVCRGREIDTLVDAALGADWTIIVAPETDGILVSRVAAVRAAGGRVLAPHEAFLAIASDKQATIDCLAAAGVAVPAGRSLAPLEAPPAGFRMPAVRKHRGSAGGDGLVLLRSANVAPSQAASRLESFGAGTPIGVAVLCGPGGLSPMPPMRQRFSEEDFPRYLGSEPWNDHPGTERAIRLAERAVSATLRAAASRAPAAGRVLGWVGVDMILGARDDGVEDRVLEINPRLTTSFLGLSAGQEESLVAAMVAIAEGRPAGTSDRVVWKPGIAFSLD